MKVPRRMLEITFVSIFLLLTSWIAFSAEYSPEELRKAKFELIRAKKLFHTVKRQKWEDRNLSKYKEAIRRAKKVVDGYPGSKLAMEARNLMIRCHEDLGNWDAFSDLMGDQLKELEDTKGKDHAIKYVSQKADVSYRTGDYEKALQSYDVMKYSFPEDKELLAKADYYIARSYSKMGQSGSAEKKLVTLLASDIPKQWDKQSRIALGHLYLSENKQTSAVEVFKEFLKEYPKDEMAPYAQYSIAWGYWAMRRKEESVLAYQQVIDKYPRSPYAKKAKAEVEKLADEVFKSLDPGDILD